MRALSVLGFIIMGAGFGGLVVVGSLFSSSPVAIAIQLGAVALSVWARLAFGMRSFHVAADPTEGGIVRSGPYRFIRHPIYAAVCLLGWAGVLAHRTLGGIGLALVLTGGAVIRILCEERLLILRHREYRDYARTTKRLVPFLF
jgi:protein-S-isoprenylcysteine O-methyltransferase Ste14